MPTDALAQKERDLFRKLSATGLISVAFGFNTRPVFHVIFNLPGSATNGIGRLGSRSEFYCKIQYPVLPQPLGQVCLHWPSRAERPLIPEGLPESETKSHTSEGPSLADIAAAALGKVRVFAKDVPGLHLEYPAMSLALAVCCSLDAVQTQGKLHEAGLDNLFRAFCHRPFRIKGSGKTFAIKQSDSLVVGLRRLDDLRINQSERVDTLAGKVGGAPLLLQSHAADSMFEHVGWGGQTADNKVEQGGLLVGERLLAGDDYSALVTATIPARNTQGSSTYVKFDHRTWNRMLDFYDELVAAGKIEQTQRVIGWYHTHPNMNVFMSGTDTATQRTLFGQPWNFALVLNPQQQLIGCFKGASASPAPLILVRRSNTSL